MTNYKKAYIGTFNYQGEVHTLYSKKAIPTISAAYTMFTKVLAKKLQRTPNHIRTYFSGEKDNYEIREVQNG